MTGMRHWRVVSSIPNRSSMEEGRREFELWTMWSLRGRLVVSESCQPSISLSKSVLRNAWLSRDLAARAVFRFAAFVGVSHWDYVEIFCLVE